MDNRNSPLKAFRRPRCNASNWRAGAFESPPDQPVKLFVAHDRLAPDLEGYTGLDLTLDAIRVRGWQAVLLSPRSKQPAAPKGKPWPLSTDQEEIRNHVVAGSGNAGLIAHERTGLAVVDVDDGARFAEMEAALGRLGDPWVMTGSGKTHIYIAWESNLPAKLRWADQKVGEVQRGNTRPGADGQQQIVAPPSIHPGTGRAYRWLVNPVTAPLGLLPEAWRAYFASTTHTGTRSTARPVLLGSAQTFTDLEGAALQQPGARRRADRVKFQCPQCREEGHDRHEDNAALFVDTGGWGCAYTSGSLAGRRHWLAIGVALGALDPTFVIAPWTRRTA